MSAANTTPMLTSEIHEALRRAAPGANALLRELEAAERRAAGLHDRLLDMARMERRTRGLRARVDAQ